MTADLPDSLADSWQPAGTRAGESSVMVASITAETTLYEPVEPTALAARGASEIPIRSLFVVDLSISPSLSTIGISPESAFEKAAPKAKGQFVDIVENEGLIVDGTRDSLEFEAPNGSEGTWYVLDVRYPLEAVDERPDGDEERADDDGHYLPAEANVAVWPTDSTFGVAGGILPLAVEGGEDADEADDAGDPLEALANGGGQLEDAIDPERDRNTISTLVQRLDLEGGESDD